MGQIAERIGDRIVPNIRPVNQNKYNISKHHFFELYHFCMQYPEWKDELQKMTDTIKSVRYSEGIKAESAGNPTERLALRRAKIAAKCELIEQTAIEADEELYPYIIKGVTEDYASYKYLHEVMGIPCGKNLYYEKRRKFYWLLSRKKEGHSRDKILR